jgi:hypothetical protein
VDFKLNRVKKLFNQRILLTVLVWSQYPPNLQILQIKENSEKLLGILWVKGEDPDEPFFCGLCHSKWIF